MKKYKLSSDTSPFLGIIEADSIEAALDAAIAQLGCGEVLSDTIHNECFAAANLWIGGKTVYAVVTITTEAEVARLYAEPKL